MDASLLPSFERTASAASKRADFAIAFDDLLAKVTVKVEKQGGNLDAIEKDLRIDFRDFLKTMGYELAVKNFDALLKEKSGDKFKRNDGTVSWYHEFIPIIMAMKLARMGADNSGMNLEDLEEYGGMEVLICSHLRHDSVEDHLSDINTMLLQQQQMIKEIQEENPGYDVKKGFVQIEQIAHNVSLVTQERLTDEEGNKIIDTKGKQPKEDVRDYTHRMVVSKYANPIVFMMKQADIIHNFATFFGAAKFTADRRLKRCNEREDMYGARYGFTDLAIEQWPKFSKSIQVLDNMMGQLLYIQFRYLESVDLHYKTPKDYAVSSRYARKALTLDLPEWINPLHIGIKRMMHSVDPAADPQKFARLTTFIDKVIKPSLEKFKDKFPYLFVAPATPQYPQPRLAAG